MPLCLAFFFFFWDTFLVGHKYIRTPTEQFFPTSSFSFFFFDLHIALHTFSFSSFLISDYPKLFLSIQMGPNYQYVCNNVKDYPKYILKQILYTWGVHSQSKYILQNCTAKDVCITDNLSKTVWWQNLDKIMTTHPTQQSIIGQLNSYKEQVLKKWKT